MDTRRWALLALCMMVGGLSVAATEFDPFAGARRLADSTEANAEPQRLIVRLRANTSTATAKAGADALTQLATRSRATLKSSRQLVAGLHVIEIAPTSSGEPVAAMLARLRADPAVQYADIDARRYAHAVPNDPLYTGQWYLQNASNTVSAVNAQAAWDLTTGGAGVVIADLDTGIRYDHPDLKRSTVGGRLLPGFDFVADSAIANDGDGRDADPADPGDWVTSADVATSRFRGCTAEGSSWHGTRTAGIIGALANNGTGLTGLNWNGFILPVRVLGKCGGFDSDIIAGMLWAAGFHVDGVPDNPYPARIENLSLGSSGSCSASYRDVIAQLAARRVLVVASAGNSGGPVELPANCPGVAGVAGLRHAGTKVGYSSLGPEIAVSAPAGNCVNVGAGQPCLFSIDTTTNSGTTSPGNDIYTDQSNYNVGTSFSAPVVTGVAGLMLSVNGNLDGAQLTARLRESATTPFPVSGDANVPMCHVPTGSADVQSAECSCTTSTCGAGMANALGAVNAALRPIAAIAVPASVAAGGNVVLQGSGSAASCRHSIASYAWSVVAGGSNAPAIQGALTSTATVIAPASGSFTLRLTVTDESGRQDSADVVVTPASASTTAPANAGSTACLAAIAASLPTVAISPTTASLTVGSGTQSFAATVTNAADTSVTWQVEGVTGGNATVGTISGSGLYTAPASLPGAATVTVAAVSVANPSRNATAVVALSAPIVTPPSVTPSSGGGGGGGGSLDLLTLLALMAAALLRSRQAGQGITRKPRSSMSRVR